MTTVENNKIFEVSPEVLLLNDPRVILMKTGRMSQIEFMRLIRHDDPFQIMNGRLMLITKDMQDTQKKGFIASQRGMMLQTGGIQPSLLLDDENFVKVYPEISTDIEEVKKDLDLATCKGCEKNRKLQPILLKLLAIKYDGRDISSLKISDMAKLKLTGQLTKEYVDSIPIVMPQGLEKREIAQISGNEIDPSLIQNPLLLVRPDCEDCFVKHLSTAAVILQEVITGGYTFLNGYYHEDIVSAELREAADEIARLDPEKAKKAIDLEKQVNQLKNNNDKNLKLPIIHSIYETLRIVRPGVVDHSFETIGLLNRLEQLLVISIGDIQSSEIVRDIRLKFANQKEKAKTF